MSKDKGQRERERERERSKWETMVDIRKLNLEQQEPH